VELVRKSRLESTRVSRRAPPQADRHPRQRQRGAAAHDLLEHAAPLRSERHADADLIGALRHGVGNHPIYANRGKQQRHTREGGDQHRTEARLRHGCRPDVRQCSDVTHGGVWVGRANLTFDLARDRRDNGRAHHQVLGRRSTCDLVS
jgi:hypothetical protein